MNSGPNFSGEAKVHYASSDFLIMEPGAYVLCAVTSERIPVDQLKYWSEDLQEAYVDAKASTKRWQETQNKAAV